MESISSLWKMSLPSMVIITQIPIITGKIAIICQNATDTLDNVFVAATTHDLTPELQVLDLRRDKAVMGIKIQLNSYSYIEETETVKAASVLMINYLSYGERIDKMSYQQATAGIDALLTDWKEYPTLLAAFNTLSLCTWVGLMAQLNKHFNKM